MKEFIKYKNRFVGYIKDNNAYYSKRTTDHQFHIFKDGFGMSVVVLNILRERFIEDIFIIFKNKLYKSSVQMFFDEGEKYKDGNDNQLIIPFHKFEELEYKNKQEKLRF